MRSVKYVAAVVAAAVSSVASAGVIENSAGQFDRAISSFDPIGQTFTAIDPQLVSIAFAFSDMNPSFPNEPVTMTLYSGAGFGTPVHSVTATLPAVLPGTLSTPVFIDFDFTGIATAVGSVYTVAVSVPSSPKVGVVYDTANHYAGGAYIDSAGVNSQWELNFRVVGVPTPGAASLAGLALIGAAKRRRR